MSEMDAEIDFLHWRMDQMHLQMVDLAERLGQDDFAYEVTKFHNNNIIPALKKMREDISDE